MNVGLQSCPSLQLLQSFFQNIALNEWLSLFQFYRENVLTSRSVDPKQP